MQKEDVQWAVLGILILLVIALVIKPMMTGEPVNLGLPQNTVSEDQNTTTFTQPSTPRVTQSRAVPTTAPTSMPTTVWNKAVQTVGFVNPATYGENLTEPLPNSTKFNTSPATIRNTSMTTYATFSGKYSGATQVVQMPFPYWEMWYSVEPVVSSLQDTAKSSTGSYSTAMPTLSIEVVDAADPNRIVRAISPPGGIDPSLWKDDDSDPRPWKEKFYEGQRSYYFIIKTHLLSSYTIDIKVPTSYVGAY
jgi:biopolymer transport protein ExbD